jgi:hypothetical protein
MKEKEQRTEEKGGKRPAARSAQHHLCQSEGMCKPLLEAPIFLKKIKKKLHHQFNLCSGVL